MCKLATWADPAVPYHVTCQRARHFLWTSGIHLCSPCCCLFFFSPTEHLGSCLKHLRSRWNRVGSIHSVEQGHGFTEQALAPSRCSSLARMTGWVCWLGGVESRFKSPFWYMKELEKNLTCMYYFKAQWGTLTWFSFLLCVLWQMVFLT